MSVTKNAKENELMILRKSESERECVKESGVLIYIERGRMGYGERERER